MEKMHILCATDDNYVPHCGIMLTSLAENNRDVDLHIYIFTGGLSEDNREKFKELANKYGIRIEIITVDAELLNVATLSDTIKEGNHVTIETYYRLLAPILLPKDVDRVLYLDVDMVINASLKELYHWDIKNYALGAVLDENHHAETIYKRLGYPKSKQYFNAGVLLINLDYWRKNNVFERCLQCLEQEHEKLLFHDQDLLNIVLQDEKIFLPLTYNFQTGFYWKKLSFTADEKKHILKASIFPAVLHFSGTAKPWAELSPHPYTDYYLYYKRMSLWRKTPLIKKSLKFKIVNLLWHLGIKKKPESIYLLPKQIFPKK